MFNTLNKMKSFSLDIPVLKETIAKLQISIKNIEKIGADVKNIGDRLVSESWEGQATNSFMEHQQDWNKDYDQMLRQLIDFKESLEKVVLSGAEEINEVALELAVPLGGSKGTGNRNIISMELEGIQELKANSKTIIFEDYECQREIMERIEDLSSRLHYPFSIGAEATRNKRLIEENQEKLQSFKGKLQNYEDRVLQFEKEVVDEMSKYAVICGHKLDSASFREVLKYQKDDNWKALLSKNVEELSAIERLVLKAECESEVTYRIAQYISRKLGIEDLSFEDLNSMQAEERGKKVSDIFSGISRILSSCEVEDLPVGLMLGKDLTYTRLPFTSLEKNANDVGIMVTIKNAFNTFKSVHNFPLYQVDQAMNVFNNCINGIAALIQGKEVTWSDKGISYALNQAFDKTENYEDKFTEGNISGCYLNFEGEILGLPKAIVLNAYNNYDSLVSGHGLQGWMRKMDFLNCENEYFERRGERALSEKILEENQYIGIGYILVMEILTDPLTFAGGEIAAAKGVSEIGSLRYMEELKNGATIYTKTYEAEKLAKAATVVDDIAKKGVQYEKVDDIAKVDNVIESGSKAPDYVKLSQELGDKINNEGYKILNTKSAEIANREWADMGFDLPPVAANTTVYTVEAGNFSYSRVYLEKYNRPMSNFILRTDDIAGLSAEEIAQKYALSKVPNKIVTVELPFNVPLEVSIVGPQESWGTIGSDVQYAIKDVDLNSTWFSKISDL